MSDSEPVQIYLRILAALLDARELAHGRLSDDSERAYGVDLDRCWALMTGVDQARVEQILGLSIDGLKASGYGLRAMPAAPGQALASGPSPAPAPAPTLASVPMSLDSLMLPVPPIGPPAPIVLQFESLRGPPTAMTVPMEAPVLAQEAPALSDQEDPATPATPATLPEEGASCGTR